MLTLSSKSPKIIKFNINKIGITDKKFNELPFGRQIEYFVLIEKFKSSPATKKVWISQKHRTNKQAFEEFKKLYLPKEFYYSTFDDKNYKDDSFEIFYRD